MVKAFTILALTAVASASPQLGALGGLSALSNFKPGGKGASPAQAQAASPSNASSEYEPSANAAQAQASPSGEKLPDTLSYNKPLSDEDDEDWKQWTYDDPPETTTVAFQEVPSTTAAYEKIPSTTARNEIPAYSTPVVNNNETPSPYEQPEVQQNEAPEEDYSYSAQNKQAEEQVASYGQPEVQENEQPEQYEPEVQENEQPEQYEPEVQQNEAPEPYKQPEVQQAEEISPYSKPEYTEPEVQQNEAPEEDYSYSAQNKQAEEQVASYGEPEVQQQEQPEQYEPEVQQNETPSPYEQPEVQQNETPSPYEQPEVQQNETPSPYEQPEVQQQETPSPYEQPEVQQQEAPSPYEQPEVQQNETPSPYEQPEVQQNEAPNAYFRREVQEGYGKAEFEKQKHEHATSSCTTEPTHAASLVSSHEPTHAATQPSFGKAAESYASHVSSSSIVQAKQSSSVWSAQPYTTPEAKPAVHSSTKSCDCTTSHSHEAKKQQQQSTTLLTTSSAPTAAATTPLKDQAVPSDAKILINPLANTTTATPQDDVKKNQAYPSESTETREVTATSIAMVTAQASKVELPYYPTGAVNTTSGLAAAASTGSVQSNNTLPEFEGAAASSSSFIAGSVIALAIAAFAL